MLHILKYPGVRFRITGGEIDLKRFTRLIAFLLVLACLPFAAAERLDDKVLLSYFDDSAFFSDSRGDSLMHYVNSIRQTDPSFLQGMKLITVGSISLYMASRKFNTGPFQFKYRNRKLALHGIVDKMQPKKVFVLLGLNDPVGAKPEKAVDWAETIIKNVRETKPDTIIHFLSETPVTENYDREKEREGYQASLDHYNELLKAVCEKNDALYINVADALKGEDNYLKLDYSNDKVCHLSEEGNTVLIEALKDFAQERYDLGLWDPFAEETENEKAE